MKHKKESHDRFLERIQKDVKDLEHGKKKHKERHKHPEHHAEHKKETHLTHPKHHLKHEAEHHEKKHKHLEHHKPEHHAKHKEKHRKHIPTHHNKIHHVEHQRKKHQNHKEEHLNKHQHYLERHHEHKPEHKNKTEYHLVSKHENKKPEHKMKHEIHNVKHHAEHEKSERQNVIHEHHKKHHKIKNKKKHAKNKINLKNIPTLNLKSEKDIAMDFATKVYQRFNKLVKSVVLFGSATKQNNVPGSDIDIIIILDDASIRWDNELVAWYREELEKIVKANPYNTDLHINTIKLTTWWEDLIRGDPVVINVIRDGETLIDFGGFFDPLKYLLVAGKIKSTPEAIHSLLERAPMHIMRSKASEIGAIEGLFWSMVDSAQAALIAIGIQAPSPEHLSAELKINFVDSGKLKMKYVIWYRDLFVLHKRIVHKEISDLKGVEIDEWQSKAHEFLEVMAKLVDEIIS